MEKNNSKSGGLFQSVASKISRFFKRDASAPVSAPETEPEEKQSAEPEPNQPTVPEPEHVAITESVADTVQSPAEAPILQSLAEKPETTIDPAVEMPQVSVGPVVKESQAPISPVVEEPKVSVCPTSAVPALPREENHTIERALRPELSAQLKQESVASRPSIVQNHPVQEPVATEEQGVPSAAISLAALTSKRRLHISDLSREEAELLLSTYVQEHLSDEQLSVETMAVQLKVSRTGLYQLVHDIFDVTPANYILDCRLKHASELLLMGKKVRDVSSKCGFSDPKYFSKVFKKYFGVLPSNYGAAE